MKTFSDGDRIKQLFNSDRIKGRTKIVLTDVNTGRQEIQHDENMLTDAVYKFFEANFLGINQIYDYIPMTSLFNGVFCFRDPLTESAGNIFPAANNPLVANGGPTAKPLGNTSTTRGNPVSNAWETGDGYIKMVWLWDLTEGNGTISAVSLTSGAAGDCGLYPDGTLPLLKTLGVGILGKNQNSGADIGATLDRTRAQKMPMSVKTNGDGLAVWLDGDEFEEMTVRHSFICAGLIEGIAEKPDSEFRVVSTRSATLSRSYNRGYAQIGQDASYYYVFERDSSSANVLYYEKIAKSDMSVSSGSLTISGATLARVLSPDNTTSGGTLLYNAIVSDGSVYWVSGSDAKTFVRINIANQADITILDSDMTNNIQPDQMPVILGAGMVIGRNFLINGGKVYPLALRTARPSGQSGLLQGSETFAPYDGGPSFYQNSYYRHANVYEYLSSGGVLALPYMATINNLQNAVTKTNQKTMRLEYTLTEI